MLVREKNDAYYDWSFNKAHINKDKKDFLIVVNLEVHAFKVLITCRMKIKGTIIM